MQVRRLMITFYLEQSIRDNRGAGRYSQHQEPQVHGDQPVVGSRTFAGADTEDHAAAHPLSSE